MRWLLPLLLMFAGTMLPGTAAAEVPKCTAARAESVTIETIQADPEKWTGHCARIRGIAVGWALFADRAASFERPEYVDEDARRALALYPGKWGKRRGPRRVEVVGPIGSCVDAYRAVAAMRAEQPDQIIMIGGFCHTSMATYVMPLTLRVVDPAPVPRFTEAEIARDQRTLVEAPANMPGVEARLATARAYLTALADHDEKGFAQLARDWLDNAHRDFTRLMRVPGLAALLAPGHMVRSFVETDELDETAPGLLVCWCKGPDCTGRWPVRRFDADNLPERPYLCVESGEELVERGKYEPYAELTIESSGFAEPAWDQPAGVKSTTSTSDSKRG